MNNILLKVENSYLKQSFSKGKMIGVPSLSTSPLENKTCQALSKIESNICNSCFSIRSLKFYGDNFKEFLKNNGDILSKPLTNDQIKAIKVHSIYFRFESHGDLLNYDHLDNLVKIAKNNKGTKFALWTKKINLAEFYFSCIKKPKNLQLVYSSVKYNKSLDINKYKHPDKIFTVYDKKYIKNNSTKINCGSRSCFDCALCYNKNKIKYINEIKK